jgi:excisionase family DNA binding protein
MPDDSITPIRGRTYACGVDAEAEDTCDRCPDPDQCIDRSYDSIRPDGQRVSVDPEPAHGEESDMNVREVARALGVHENTVRNWANRGLLSPRRLPGSGFRRFSREQVERMRREMYETYAPATALPEPRRAARGQTIDGDLLPVSEL